MRIGIDARFALYLTRGIGRYTRELIKGIASLDRENEYFLYVDRPDTNNNLPDGPNFHLRIVKPSFYPLWEQVMLVKALKRDEIQVFHALGNTGPILLPKNIKYALTLHDVIFLKPGVPRSPVLYQQLGKIYRKLSVPIAAKRADRIITDSKAQRDDVIRILKKNAKDVTAIYLGIDELLEKKNSLVQNIDSVWDELKQRYNIKGPFLFTVGGTAPIHLTIHVIKVFEVLLKEDSCSEVQLVVCGTMGEKDTYLHKYAEEKGILSNIIFTDYLSDEELLAFYHNASVFVYFLLTNGFELPIIEAMSCGVPCVFSDTPPIPELYEGAGIIVDHFNISEVKEALMSVLTDKDRAEQLRQEGFKRVKMFSSQKMAEETLNVYSELE